MLAQPGYVPGACNIGPAEIERRRRSFHAMAAFTTLAFALLLAFRVAPAWHLLLFLPAVGAAVSWLQAYRKFCVAFAFGSAFNFGPLGVVSRVADPAARRLDRRLAWRMVGTSALIAAPVALAATAIAALIG